MLFSLPEWLVISLIWAFVTWLILQRFPDGMVQNTLVVGNLFAWLGRLFVLYHHGKEWDALSRYMFSGAVFSAIFLWFCIEIRRPSHIPKTARMQRKAEKKRSH